MSSVAYPENATRKNLSAPWARIVIILGISLGLLWFAIDFPFYIFFESQSAGWLLWISYANDLFLPFAFYFFICLGERWMKTWQSRALLAFILPTLWEIGQGLYYQFSPKRYVGSFDLMDIAVYAVSVGLAVLLEQKVFAKIFRFW